MSNRVDPLEGQDDKDFADVLKSFVLNLYDILKCSNFVWDKVVDLDIDAQEKILKTLKSGAQFLNEEIDVSKGSNELILSEQAKIVLADLQRAMYSKPPFYSDILINSLYLNIFSQFDEFIGELLTVLFNLRPGLLEESEKNFSVSDIFSYPNIEMFKKSIIEKEIDTIRRESYVKQIEIFEKKFKVKLKEFENWSEFVEVTQRRNIIMHCGGIVTEQYINICKENGYEDISSKGSKVDINVEYLNSSIFIMLEVGIKLVQVLWRKQFKHELNAADNALNSIIFQMLHQEEFEFSLIISEFALKLPNISDLEMKFFFLINHCIALKQLEMKNELEKTLKSVDWTVVNSELQIAKKILSDTDEDLVETMLQVGAEGKYFNQHAYATWPLFQLANNNQHFKTGFFNLYNITLEEYLNKVANKQADELESTALHGE
ncbi:hypothetical protein GCM10008014_24890 [Paenibacillus silvae]|uniref:Uncharacterized protein n=1 Tax=Paenibacillus silvae TaxID=1325358 RepID=A0ABQ1ZDC9_9BACL|nr:hypothetical protein [Paenibacillus silvae]GGH55353.1 hypothetical protein GCM10008014_24890 [Paenibacillus silvae]